MPSTNDSQANPSCDLCRFYVPHAPADGEPFDPEFGTCHKSPPIVAIYPITRDDGVGGMASFTAWPEPPEPRWCAAFDSIAG
jgi:hypothetical protein